MSTIYTRQGNRFFIGDTTMSEQVEKLPPANYVIRQPPMGGPLYFEKIDSFVAPQKIYGEAVQQVDRFISTYLSRPKSTGIMLSGEKGSGKTMTGQLTSIKAASQGIPTIIVDAPWCGGEFNQLLQAITQPCIIFFDEFEKVYPSNKQEELLTLLDGVFTTKKLFLFTINNKYKIDSNMMNRPGRIFYFLEYEGLDYDFVMEYCKDNLKNQEHAESVGRLSSIFDHFNHDILKALVEEMNRYGESATQALKYLNAKPESQHQCYYDAKIFVNDKPVEGEIYDDEFYGNPLSTPRLIFKEYLDEDDDNSIENHVFTVDDIRDVSGKKGEYIYIKGNKKLVLTRQTPKKFDLATNGYAQLGI